jgi:hypothetical protein
MLNRTEKKIVFLDQETLRYMYLTFTGEKVYPVMKKLYATLVEGYESDRLVTPLWWITCFPISTTTRSRANSST